MDCATAVAEMLLVGAALPDGSMTSDCRSMHRKLTQWKEWGEATTSMPSHVSPFGTPLLSWPTDRSISTLYITSTLTWKEHAASILQKVSWILGVLYRLRRSLAKAALRKIYSCYIRAILEYASVALSNVTRNEADQLERFQRWPARLILGIPLFACVNHFELLVGAGLPTFESRRECALAVLGHQLPTRKVPSHLENVNMPKRATVYQTGSTSNHISSHCSHPCSSRLRYS